MSSAKLSCSSRNNRIHLLTYRLLTLSGRRRTAVLQSWVVLPKPLVWTQAQPPARWWSRSGHFVVEEEECSSRDWSSEVEILCPQLSLLPRTGCSIGRDLWMSSGLWAKIKHFCASSISQTSSTSMPKHSLGAQPGVVLLSQSRAWGSSFLVFHCYFGYAGDSAGCGGVVQLLLCLTGSNLHLQRS